jgi:transposase
LAQLLDFGFFLLSGRCGLFHSFILPAFATEVFFDLNPYVVMDNLPAHKVDSITSMIESVGASILCLSPYSPDFNPIELWWSQLKSLLRQFSPTTTKMVDTIIAVALDLINPKHLKNWFTNCCYCTL